MESRLAKCIVPAVARAGSRQRVTGAAPVRPCAVRGGPLPRLGGWVGLAPSAPGECRGRSAPRVAASASWPCPRACRLTWISHRLLLPDGPPPLVCGPVAVCGLVRRCLCEGLGVRIRSPVASRASCHQHSSDTSGAWGSPRAAFCREGRTPPPVDCLGLLRGDVPRPSQSVSRVPWPCWPFDGPPQIPHGLSPTPRSAPPVGPEMDGHVYVGCPGQPRDGILP